MEAIMSNVCTLSSFRKNIGLDGFGHSINQLQKKVFFEVNLKRKKPGQVADCFSLQQLLIMEQSYLDKAIFTFDSTLASNPLKFNHKMMQNGQQNTIKELNCADELDTIHIPSFNFFKVRK